MDCRVITATNAPLEERIEAGTFRPDLYYRLNVYPIHVLPLRERLEDILPLAEHFLSVYAQVRSLPFEGFSPAAADLLLTYDFPGNARELRNIIERAAIHCRSGQILPEHLNLPQQPGKFPSSQPVPTPCASGQSDEDVERTRILSALEASRWNRQQAARALGMTYAQLRYRILKLGIG